MIETRSTFSSSRITDCASLYTRLNILLPYTSQLDLSHHSFHRRIQIRKEATVLQQRQPIFSTFRKARIALPISLFSANLHRAMEAMDSTWQDAAHNLMDRTLPPICPRPESLFSLPSIIFSDTECFKASLSLALGLGIIMFAGVIKLPQIATIINNKSVAGLSGATFLFETFGYTYNLAAHYRQNYPVSTYGDFIILILENYYILYLFYSLKSRTQYGLVVITAYFAGLMFLCSPYFPLELLQLMTLANVPVVVMTRTPQVYANFVNGSTGALSALTCWGIFLGACARIFTTIQDVDSFNILIGYLVAALLNGIIAFQVIFYRFAKPAPEDKEKKST